MLSKDEVEAEKAAMRAIDARPIKKVAEAKQRKRKRLQVAFFSVPSSCISSNAGKAWDMQHESHQLVLQRLVPDAQLTCLGESMRQVGSLIAEV